jgi:hypothetical protein
MAAGKKIVYGPTKPIPPRLSGYGGVPVHVSTESDFTAIEVPSDRPWSLEEGKSK